MRDKSRALTGTQGPARPVRDRAEREALHGDRHGTTTPAAMPLTLRKPVLDDRPFCANARATDELAGGGNKTGGTRLHIGLPPDWRVGDKAGQSERRTTPAVLAAAASTSPGDRTEAPETFERRNTTIAAEARVRWRGVGGVVRYERPMTSSNRQFGGNQ